VLPDYKISFLFRFSLASVGAYLYAVGGSGGSSEDFENFDGDGNLVKNNIFVIFVTVFYRKKADHCTKMCDHCDCFLNLESSFHSYYTLL